MASSGRSRMKTPLIKTEFPEFPGLWKALGPGIVWLALAQGSGELIWWPYIIAKYGLAFLFLLVPACLLQFPLNYQIGSYTLLTGESIFQGFLRLNRFFAFFLWVLATVSFFWFGAFASAGGTSLAALTDFPHGWGQRGQTLFWAYTSMGIFLLGILSSKVVYRFIEKFMWLVALVTVVGLLCAVCHPEVRSTAGAFFKGLFAPQWPEGRTWDPADLTKLLTAITFAGLGGFWTLFYSYWLKEKGVGMAHYMGHVAGAFRHAAEEVHETGYTFEGTEKEYGRLRKWKRFLSLDVGIGVFGNIFTTLMTCLLAYALLFPQNLFPQKYEIAVVQASFFEVSWGVAGRLIFLFVAACFLSDTWITTLDAVSRMQTDFVRNFFKPLRRISFEKCYYFFVVLFTLITFLTILFKEPGPLILLSAVIGFVGTVTFSFGVLFLNYGRLRQLIPKKALPGRLAFGGALVAALAYLTLAVLYFGNLLNAF